MTTLQVAVGEYLSLRRGLGFKLDDAGRMLPEFVTFLEKRGACVITCRLALDWAQQLSTVQPTQWAGPAPFRWTALSLCPC